MAAVTCLLTSARRFATVCVVVLIMSIWLASGLVPFAHAAEPAVQEPAVQESADQETSAVIAHSAELLASLEQGEMQEADRHFAQIKKWWTQHKATLKRQSLDMSLEIDRQIAGISLALLNKDMLRAADEAGALQFSLRNYADGAYIDNSGKQRMTLNAYVMKLRQAADLMQKQQWQEARGEIKLLQRQWLSVEGDVVSRSQTVYNHAERDLVLLDAYLGNEEQREQALPVAERLIASLAPLAGAQYAWWDAALIPLREGIEALLVVGTLLMYAGKANSRTAKHWIAGGASAGLLLCVAAGFLVAVVLSSGAFGHSNLLINGCTGVLASVLLLYVSYWLHRNADLKRWNKFLQLNSTRAITGGRMISLALLAFFAIVREGLETVIFLIGMAGKIPASELAGGIAAGFGILAICAVVMIKLGSRLPIRPVFLVSSAVVFYLCFKFMGSGIHSLQMAGVIPATAHEYLPEYSALSLYSSWYSTLPQLLFVLLAVSAVVFRTVAGRSRKINFFKTNPEIQ